MRFISLLLVSIALLVFEPSWAAAQLNDIGKSTNIVIGDGCASTCINGQCERSCKGTSDNEYANTVTEKAFDFIDFNQVMVDDIDMKVSVGDDFAVRLIHVPESINEVKVSIDKRTLKVSLPSGYKSRYKARVEVTMPTLKGVQVAGNSDSSFSGFELDDLSVKVLGNATLVGGQNDVAFLSLEASDNADLNFFSSRVDKAEVRITDNATVKIKFSDQERTQLTGSVDSMADLLYCGNPLQSVTATDMSDVSSARCDQ